MVYAVIQGCSVTQTGDLAFQVQWCDSDTKDTGVDQVLAAGTGYTKQTKLAIQTELATKVNARFGGNRSAAHVRLTSLLNDTLAPQFAQLHRVDTRSGGASGRLMQSDYFTTDQGANFPTATRYVGLAQREVYSWQGNKLLAKLTTTYFVDGSVASTETESYRTDSATGQVVVSIS